MSVLVDNCQDFLKMKMATELYLFYARIFFIVFNRHNECLLVNVDFFYTVLNTYKVTS